MSETKRVFIKTYGCQMNVYDSERMSDILAPMGYQPSETAEDADLVILNTCHIREKAAEKVYSELGRLREIKAERAASGQTTMIAVAGCVAQAEGEEIVRRAPVVDMVVGPQSYHRIPDMLARVTPTPLPAVPGLGPRILGGPARAVVETDFPTEDKFDHMGAPDAARIRSRGVTAFLTVQEGCDKFCTFCVVPYTRGAETSRPVERIVTEAEALAAAGVREVTLLGQNVNAFHGIGPEGEGWSLAKLVTRLAAVPGLDRIRYTTSHPRDMGEDLIAAHRDLPQLMPYLHLPVQSGSDAILDAMNRRHTADDYRRLVDRIRAARPDIALSGDFIVGFPGETDPDFEATMQLVRDIGYASAFTFKYSARPGTPAATMGAMVPPEVASERLQRLQELVNAEEKAFMAGLVGRRLPVLFEKAGRDPGQIVGRSPYLQPVHVDGPLDLIGSIADVEIDGAGRHSLFGRLADAATDVKVRRHA